MGERLTSLPDISSSEIFSLSCSSSEGDKDSSTVSQEDGAVIVAMDGGGGVMSLDDFQALPSDRQSEEIFKLLSMLSPFASEVTSLRSSMENALNRLDHYHKFFTFALTGLR